MNTATNPAACEKAAQALNGAVETAFNDGLNRDQLMERIMPVFRKYSNLGAMDSEPLAKLEEVLDKLYPDSRENFR